MIFDVKLELWFWSRRNRKWSENGFVKSLYFIRILKQSDKTVFEQNFEQIEFITSFCIVIEKSLDCGSGLDLLFFLFHYQKWWNKFFLLIAEKR